MKYRFSGIFAITMAASLTACGGAPVVETQRSSSIQSSVDTSSAVSSAPQISSSVTSNSTSMSIPVSSASAVSSVAAADLTIQENSPGYCGTEGEVEDEHTGFTGAGFVNSDNRIGASIYWQVQSTTTTTAHITIRYANGGDAARSGILAANGNDGSATHFDLALTGGWTTWVDESKDIALEAGVNQLALSAESGEGLANIDSITIAGIGITAETCAFIDNSSSANSSVDNNSNGMAPHIGASANFRAAKLEGFGASTTGGKGGQVVYASTGTQINQAICSRASESTPLIIMVNGTITHGNTSKASGACDTSDSEIQFKEVSNISLIGMGTSAVFDQIGVKIVRSSNIIVQNLHIKNVKKSGSPISNGGDAIAIQDGPIRNIWVDHNTLEASGGESDGYDSLIDIKKDSQNITVSYNHLRNSSRGGLVQASDSSDDGSTDISFHHNWYENIEQRTQLFRYGRFHSYNNYWSTPTLDFMIKAVGARANAKVLVEGNYFFNVNNPIISTDGPMDKPGCWQTADNKFDPSIYYSRYVGDGKTSAIGEEVNGQIKNTCSVSVPYTFSLDASKDVPAIVSRNAGVGKI